MLESDYQASVEHLCALKLKMSSVWALFISCLWPSKELSQQLHFCTGWDYKGVEGGVGSTQSVVQVPQLPQFAVENERLSGFP